MIICFKNNNFKIYQILKYFFKETHLFSKEVMFLKGLVLAVFLFGGGIVTIINILKKRRQVKQGGKRWLLKEMIFSSGTSWTSFMWPLLIIYQFPHLLLVYGVSSEVLYSPISLFIISLFYVVGAITIYIIIKVIPQKAQEYLKQTYPEYEFTK